MRFRPTGHHVSMSMSRQSGVGAGLGIVFFFVVWCGFSGFMTWETLKTVGTGPNATPAIVVLLPGSFFMLGIAGIFWGVRTMTAAPKTKDPSKISITHRAEEEGSSGKMFLTIFLSVFGIFGTVFLVLMVREVSGWEYFMLLLPLLFITISVVGIRFVWAPKSITESKVGEVLRTPVLDRKRAALEAHEARLQEQSMQEDMGEFYGEQGPVELKPNAGPVAKFIGALVIGLFINGIVGFIVYQFAQSWQAGRPEWFLMIFIVVFGLVGLAMIGAIIHSFLGLFLPRPVVTINTRNLALGDTAELNWNIPGTARMTEFLITLEGREEATYRRGTDTHTETHTFYRQHIIRTSEAHEIVKGRVEFVIPHDIVPTFKASNNTIQWQIRLRGIIPNYPDIDYEYDIYLRPLPMVTE